MDELEQKLDLITDDEICQSMFCVMVQHSNTPKCRFSDKTMCFLFTAAKSAVKAQYLHDNPVQKTA